MLGWINGVHQQPHATMKSSEFEDGYGEMLLGWDSGGLEWIKALVDAGRASLLQANNGYPMIYVAEREAILEALVEYHLDANWGEWELYLRAREPKDGSWLQCLGKDSEAPGVTREVIWGKYSIPTIPGLKGEADLGWIDSLVKEGKAELLEDGEEKLYSGERGMLVTRFIASRMEATRDDETVVVTAWDLS